MFFLRPIFRLAINAAALAGVAASPPPSASTADTTSTTADNSTVRADAA